MQLISNFSAFEFFKRKMNGTCGHFEYSEKETEFNIIVVILSNTDPLSPPFLRCSTLFLG
jgi:hypothetical protein